MKRKKARTKDKAKARAITKGSYKNHYGVNAIEGEWSDTDYQDESWSESYEESYDNQWYSEDKPWPSYGESERWQDSSTVQIT